MPQTQLSYLLLLGSNLQDPPRQIAVAGALIEDLPEVEITRRSSIQRSKAYGKTLQDDFYNQVLEISSAREPEELMQAFLNIESRMGRVRREKWGPRIIDIDILLIGDLIIDTELLKVPHYDLHNRAFALKLICEISPDAVHPLLKKSMRDLLHELENNGGNL